MPNKQMSMEQMLFLQMSLGTPTGIWTKGVITLWITWESIITLIAISAIVIPLKYANEIIMQLDNLPIRKMLFERMFWHQKGSDAVDWNDGLNISSKEF